MNVVRDRWYAVLDSREVPKARAHGAKRLGQDLVFWRDASGSVRAAPDACPHRWAALSPGRVVDGELECPFHGFRFAGDGACTMMPAHPDRAIPAAMSLDTVAVREAHGLVWMWSGPSAPPEGPIPFFDFEGFTWTGSQLVEDVANHYTRSVENQLDWAHLPFVHRTTIGRLASDAPTVTTETEGDLIRFSVGAPENRIEFLGPNIWRNKTGPMWQFLAMVPIDDGHMRYYLRTYQPWVHLRPLAWLLGKTSALLNRVVIRQDTPLVESQPVGEVRLRTGEVLQPMDAPIIAYRRWREALRTPDA